MKKYQAIIAVCLSASLILAGCAHTTANPVPVAQVGDETRGCQSLWQEIQQMQMTLHTSSSDSSQQTTKNTVLGVTGAFLIVPWFFMDLGNAPEVERKAAQARLDRLYSIYSEKGCAAKEDRPKAKQ